MGRNRAGVASTTEHAWADPGALVPVPAPGEVVDHDAVFEAARRSFGFDREAMVGCDQHRVHHGEGDVLTHTSLVLDALVADPAWCALSSDDRDELFVTALLHDVAKPVTTKIEDGIIRHPGHAHRGEKLARIALWKAGVDPVVRERIAQAIRFHLHPFFVAERVDPVRNVIEISTAATPHRLAILARADARGRICEDLDTLLTSVELFELTAADAGCAEGPYAFANDQSRFEYLRRDPDAARRDPAYAAWEDPAAPEVLMTSGLPGAGKDTWLARHDNGLPSVSLDAIRTEFGISAQGPQRRVVSIARERATEHLRAKESFVWNATSLFRALRSGLIDLAAAYGARVRIVAFETPATVLDERNKTRPESDRLPEDRRASMESRWEAPTVAECHALDLIVASSQRTRTE